MGLIVVKSDDATSDWKAVSLLCIDELNTKAFFHDFWFASLHLQAVLGYVWLLFLTKKGVLYHSLGFSWGDLLEDFVAPESLAWSNYGMLFLHSLPGQLQALGNHVRLKHLKHVLFLTAFIGVSWFDTSLGLGFGWCVESFLRDTCLQFLPVPCEVSRLGVRFYWASLCFTTCWNFDISNIFQFPERIIFSYH